MRRQGGSRPKKRQRRQRVGSQGRHEASSGGREHRDREGSEQGKEAVRAKSRQVAGKQMQER